MPNATDIRHAKMFVWRTFGGQDQATLDAYAMTLAIERAERRDAGKPYHFQAIDRDLNGRKR